MNVDINLDINDIFDKAFTALAKAMNIAEEQLLPIMVKQMFVEGVAGLVIITGITIFCFILFKCMQNWYKKQKEKIHDSYSEEKSLCFYASTIVLLYIPIGLMFYDGYLMDSITKTFNPEYAVIQEVVKMAENLLNKD